MTDYAVIPIEKVKVETKLKADDGFTCIPEDAILTVQEDERGLFVYCNGRDDACFEPGYPASEHHYLDGQKDAAGENYIGFWLVEEPTP